jgi:hypothetical protein
MLACVELALDGVDVVVHRLCDQIDAGVAPVEPMPLGPNGLRDDVPIQLAVHGLSLQVCDRQLLEIGALLTVGERGGAIAVEEIL